MDYVWTGNLDGDGVGGGGTDGDGGGHMDSGA